MDVKEGPRIALEIDADNQMVEITFLYASIAEDENGNLVAGGAFDLDGAEEVRQSLEAMIAELKKLR